MRRHVVEQGVAPAVWDLKPSPPRDASGGRPALLRGSAFNGWTWEWNEGGGSRPRHAGVMLPGPLPEDGSEVKNRHSGAPGGERAGHMARGAFAKVPKVTQRLSALRSLTLVREGKEGRRPGAVKQPRPDGACLRFAEPPCALREGEKPGKLW